MNRSGVAWSAAALLSLCLAACESAGPKADTVELGIMPYLHPCVGVGPRSCMVAKQTDRDTTYGYFYDPIEGFQFEWGYRYTLKVEVRTIKNPPADGSSLKYVLVGEPVKGAEPNWISEMRLLGSQWTFAGDTMVIEGYAKRIRVADAADRASLVAWKEEPYLRLLVEPGQGGDLAGHTVAKGP